MQSYIKGVGMAVGAKVMTNEMVIQKIKDAHGEETTDDWIRERTGISTRHHIDMGQSTSTLAIEAATNALDDAEISIDEIDAIIVATMTPDFGGAPSTACLVQKAISPKSIPAFDINAACSGFLYALMLGDSLIKIHYNNVLIIGADSLSCLIDWTDRSVAPLLGDGAGAVILTRNDIKNEKSCGIIDTILYAKGDEKLLYVPAGGCIKPASLETIAKKEHSLKMSGRDVFRFAIQAAHESISALCGRNDINIHEVDWFFLHQANFRITKAISEKMEVPIEKFYSTVRSYGNTSAASIPIGIAHARHERVLNARDKIFLIAFGGGLTWGGCYLRWGTQYD